MTSPRQPGVCPDPLDLQRWLDGDASLAGADAIARHVRDCSACAARVAAIEADRALVARTLDEEDRTAAEASTAMLARVRMRLATHLDGARTPAAPRRSAWFGQTLRWRLVPAGVLLGAIALATTTALERRPLVASVDSMLSAWQVREQAWRTQPGKLRVEVYDTETWREGRQPQHFTQATWFSTVRGAEVSVTRVTSPTGDLRSAMWTRTDGSSGRFSAGRSGRGLRTPARGPTLTLDPPTAALEAVLPTLRAGDADALRLWLERRQWRIRPEEQADGQAAYLAGQVSSYTTGLGVLVAPPSVHGDRDTYRLSFTVTPHDDKGRGTALHVVDTFARGSLVLEKRLARTLARDGRLLEQTTLRLLERREAQPSELVSAMAEMENPPPHWTVVRRTAQDILPEARYMLRVLGPSQGRPATN